jgi:tRNA pseudouridine38-40 synthase
VVLEVSASAFCHQMVRSMVAICVEAGRGRLDPATVPAILLARDRGAGRGVAPAHGLTLWEVGY